MIVHYVLKSLVNLFHSSSKFSNINIFLFYASEFNIILCKAAMLADSHLKHEL